MERGPFHTENIEQLLYNVYCVDVVVIHTSRVYESVHYVCTIIIYSILYTVYMLLLYLLIFKFYVVTLILFLYVQYTVGAIDRVRLFFSL